MLIRFALEKDKEDWIKLAEDVADVFRAPDMANDPEFHAYMDSKLSKNEAIIATDRMTNACFGIIGFSRTHNRITWFGVFEKYRSNGIGEKLLKCAINQLDWGKDITVETYPDDYPPGIPAKKVYRKFGFIDIDKTLTDKLNNPIWKMAIPTTYKKKGASFHYNFNRYSKWAEKNSCPVCQGQEAPYPPILIKELANSWVECYEEAQGRLFGKCHVLSKKHSEHFYDLPRDDMANFMADVQKVAKALHQVTGAIKINYEIHGNSMPHLHAHLFPRYLNDDFPSAPIDYRITEPSPYESVEEFNWFVEKMRGLL
ncbi:GNAT family N-acetyltransferase [Vallitalea okinawensis]|uniref:GNAT family N-acetyltransferase n=1 Tax=Vallitalea okinawensis TaxID=2078660 RepID=UPI000CFD1600|nr:GNAT family N-acetyltransferase [Vallitalea okinawensis]